MLFPLVNFLDWGDEYDIPSRPSPCKRCGELQEFTIPFAYKSFRGLISEHTKCGEEFRQSVFVSSDPKERADLGEFVKRFTAAERATAKEGD